MLYIPNCELATRALKRLVRDELPSISSSHLSEALAAAAGARTHASLQAKFDGAHSAITFHDSAFVERLEVLGHRNESWIGFAQLSSRSWTNSPHKSAKAISWRNMLAAAVNTVVAQGLISLNENGNLWPGFDPDPHAHNQYLFGLALPGDLPARACIRDIGYGELEVSVALWPKSENWLGVPGAKFSAGDAVASGWLERRTGAWLMFDKKRGGMLEVAVRRHRQEAVLGIATIPLGYEDHGKFIM